MRDKTPNGPESKLVAVVVPMRKRLELTPDEQISLRHLLYFLGRYEKYIVVPSSLKIHWPDFGVKRFDDRFFGSAAAYIRMTLSPEFYEAFSDYRYILIYHLDALVFSDQLTQWCDRDFDYVGAPWVVHEDAPYAGRKAFEGKVGNGGFSLLKIESVLKVIYSQRYCIDPREYWESHYSSKPRLVRFCNLPKKYFKYLKQFNNARWEISRWNNSDDSFFANRSTHYDPSFKIPSVEVALGFAFECLPRYCFELNNRTLPFGCHAWARYEREFWEPYLLR